MIKKDEINALETDHTVIVKLVNHCLGRCRVRCSSTTARRGENNLRTFSIATALDGKTTTFWIGNGRRKVRNEDLFKQERNRY